MKVAIKTGLIALTFATAIPSSADELGRLFFTPEQRAQLEYNKSKNDSSGDDSRALIVNGIVQKNGGNRTAWINGVSQPAGKSDEHAPESLPVTIPERSEPVKVKVGQRILLNQPTDQDVPKQ